MSCGIPATMRASPGTRGGTRGSRPTPGLDRARHEEAVAALLERPAAVISAPLRAGASTTTVASARPLMIRFRRGNVPAVGARSGASSETTAPPPATIASASRACARGYSRPWPPPMTATVGRPRPSAAAWAAPSMPIASPETTLAPAAASARRDPRRRARRPAFDARRVPTTATACVGVERGRVAAHEQEVRRQLDRREPRRVGRVLDRQDAKARARGCGPSVRLGVLGGRGRSPRRRSGDSPAAGPAVRRLDGRRGHEIAPRRRPSRRRAGSSRPVPAGRRSVREPDRPEAVRRGEHGPRIPFRGPIRGIVRVGDARTRSQPSRSARPRRPRAPQPARVAARRVGRCAEPGGLVEVRLARRPRRRRGRRWSGRPGAAARSRGRSPPRARPVARRGVPRRRSRRQAARRARPVSRRVDAHRSRRHARRRVRPRRRDPGARRRTMPRARARPTMAAGGTRGISTHRSIRSRSGPETRRCVALDDAGRAAARHGRTRRSRTGTGSSRRSSWNRAGNVAARPARTIATRPSSSGWRSASSTSRSNSGSSSRNSTPWSASVTSPGDSRGPPPTIAAYDVVWWGAAERRPADEPVDRPLAGGRRHDRRRQRGRVVERREEARHVRASMVLPDPGGPISSRPWPPARAISSARRASAWPRTSARSGIAWRPAGGPAGPPRPAPAPCRRSSSSPTARRGRSATTATAATGPARRRRSACRPAGPRRPRPAGPRPPRPARPPRGARPAAPCAATIGRTPGTGRTSPPSESSPSSATRPRPGRPAPSRAGSRSRSRGRARRPPCAASAGARLTVIRRGG